MGTTVTVLLPSSEEAEVGVVAALFEEWEACLSRFRAGSELSFVNRRAGAVTIVSPLFMTVLQAALAAAEATNGVYDPTLHRHIIAAGYDRTFEVLDATSVSRARPVGPGGGWRSIQIDTRMRSVLLPNDVGLDFGGIAKGMAVDAAVSLLTSKGVHPVVVEAGGDLRVAGTLPNNEPWPIAIEQGMESDIVRLCGGGLATSSTDKRRWMSDGGFVHHLIDPATGRSSTSGVASATVGAATCAQAEVAAKAVLLLGREAGLCFLAEHGLYGLLVMDDGTVWRHLEADSAV